jgi:hypothetical protein
MAESIEYHIEEAERALRNADSFSCDKDFKVISAYSRNAAAHIALASLLVSRQMAEITERIQATTTALQDRVRQELD